MQQIRARTKEGGIEDVHFDHYPDECPVCHVAAEIKRDYAEGFLCPSQADERHRYLQIIYRCPRLSCGSHFIILYEAPRNDRHSDSPFQSYFFKRSIFPQRVKRLTIPAQVATISQRFVAIANQANAAETLALEDVAGMAYRKALEFLIKDYCIYLNPEKKDLIKSSPLMKCITTYISDGNLKECATRAAWLGNDETHYERVWNDHDIADLKTLIRLTQNWIENESLTAQYIKEMGSKGSVPKKPNS